MPDDLDIENAPALLAYLRRTGHVAPDEQPEIRNLAGGVSNRTVLLRRSSGEAWVLKQALARLRVRVEWFSDPRRIEREARGIRVLSELLPGSVPPLVFLDPEVHLLAMYAVPEPHANWKTLLMTGDLHADHVRQFASLLARVHAAGARGAARYAIEFDDRSHFESLRLEPYYLYAARRMPAVEPFISALVEETRATRYTLVHGDYSPKNALVRDGRLILLDHEVIHFGDGAFDLGFATTHLLGKANHLAHRRADYADAARTFWLTYRRELGDAPAGLESRACRHTLACLLARCVGRSPLEYLSPPAAADQANAASAMMDRPPVRMADVIDEFIRRIDAGSGRKR